MPKRIRVSRDTSSLQYENDDLMWPYWCAIGAARLATDVARRSRRGIDSKISTTMTARPKITALDAKF
jgi:hypothetical protein